VGRDPVAILAGVLTFVLLAVFFGRWDMWMEDTYQFIPLSLLMAQVADCAPWGLSTSDSAEMMDDKDMSTRDAKPVASIDMA
jgi:hypothetical protein